MMFDWGLVVVCILAISGIEANLEVITKPNDTAYRGGNITLPCQFDGLPEAVYWRKDDRTGVLDDQAKIVVQYFNGQWLSNDNPRYNIASDYSMVISDVQIEDETTYSCEVSVPNAPTGKNYTDLMVIALANPLHPVVSGCKVTEPGKCVYEVLGDVKENFVLRCRVDQVRPAVSLSWTTLGGEDRTTKYRIVRSPDKDGLFNATSELRVSRTEIENGESFVCKASGDSVKGTSALVVTVKYPSEGGLSGGGKAGVTIFVLIVIAVIGIGIGFFLWRKKKREHDDDDPAKEPLSPLQLLKSEFDQLTKRINDYEPGSFSGLEKEEGRSWPNVTRLGVFGVTHAGKSSLVRSLKYSLTGDLGTAEVAQSHSIGGVTVTAKKYALTDHLTVVDNRGMKDLDVSCINDIMDQIRGKSKLLEGTVDFPILVFDARQPVNALDKFLPDFVKAIRNEFGSHPAIVFTHRDSVGERMDTIKAQATGMGALDQKLYFIENFTKTPTEPCYERRLELLKMLETMMACADENLIVRDKKRRGNGSTKDTNVVQMDVADTNSTPGKGFFGIFKRK